eukprot:COSAG05_NODE_16379_length_347_cov_1.016129_1_plen_49_part_01
MQVEANTVDRLIGKPPTFEMKEGDTIRSLALASRAERVEKLGAEYEAKC